MKKVLTLALVIFVTVGFTAVTPLLFETYQEDTITIQPNEWDTVTVVELTFSVDSSCYVQFSTGGDIYIGYMWLELDETKLPPYFQGSRTDYAGISYSYLVDSGEHTISFILVGGIDDAWNTTLHSSYLQVLIFLPDAGGAIAERPAVEPVDEGVSSVISRGPYVTVTGATELVDASGRVIEGAIEEDRVSINNLSQGTYYARKEGKTIVKIVKVD